MASIRHIKTRIKSVSSTQQITKAMNLVSASKLQRAKQKLEATRPFFNETRRVISSIVNNSKSISHPYLEQKDVKKSLIIVITGDRGLCGGYNSNISKEALRLSSSKSAALIVTGSKGVDFFKRRNINVINSFTGIAEQPIFEDASKIGKIALDLFKSGEVDEVFLSYTEFKSTITHIPKSIRLLPVDTSDFESQSQVSASGINVIMTYDPSESEVLDYIIPKYVDTLIFGAMMEASACQQAAIMTSMDTATENASEMISKLTLVYNRARQSAITQEITEIVGGASALE